MARFNLYDGTQRDFIIISERLVYTNVPGFCRKLIKAIDPSEMILEKDSARIPYTYLYDEIDDVDHTFLLRIMDKESVIKIFGESYL